MNFSLGNFLVGLVGIIVGTLVLKEAFYLNHHIYFLDFIEKKYGPGSGTTAYRIIGLSLCVLSILVIFGVVDIVNSSGLSGQKALPQSQPTQSIIPTKKGSGGVNIAQ
jgi:hypothetical protein